MGNVTKSRSIDKAVAAIRSGECANQSDAGRKYGVHPTSIGKRLAGKTRSKFNYLSESCQCLTNTQEKRLIQYINKLSDRGMPPTSQIVKNLAEEIRKRPVGKNWVAQFVKRKGNELHSMYLRNIDNIRVAAEYKPVFNLFYKLVIFNFIVLFFLYIK